MVEWEAQVADSTERAARPPDSPSAANEAPALAQVLAENLAELESALDTLRSDDLTRRAAPDEWSIREILLHLIHAERWLHPQLYELRATIAPGPPPAVGGVTLPDAESAPDLNELRWAVNAVREDTLRLLEGLTPAQLREPANVEVAGEVVDVSFRTMILTVADHQLFHVRQIAGVLG